MPTQKSFLYLTGYSGITYSDIAAFLGRTSLSSSEQTVATQLIDSAEMFLCQQCNRQFANALAATPTTDVIFASILDAGLSKYFFDSFPVKAVSKILLDGNVVYDSTSPSTATYKFGQDFFVKPSYLLFYTKLQSVIDPHNAVEIDYTIEKFWGSDVLLAIKRWVAQIFINKEYGGNGVMRMSLTGLTLDLNVKDTPDYIKAVISSYRIANV